MYHYWRFTRLYNVYGDIVRSAKGHDFRFTPPGGGIPYGRAIHLEFALGHHTLRFSCPCPVFPIDRRQKRQKIVPVVHNVMRGRCPGRRVRCRGTRYDAV